MDDALERLDALVVYEAAKDALATMREALEQLRTERDAARVGHRVLLDAQNELIERAKSAEAELERLRRHPDAWSSLGTLLLLVECFLAEAEVQRLREERDQGKWVARETADNLHSTIRINSHAGGGGAK